MSQRTRPRTFAERRKMDYDDVVNTYKQALLNSRLSRTTQEQYVSRARALGRFLQARQPDPVPISAVCPESVRAFLHDHARGVLPVTSYQCHVQITHWCKWLKRNNYTASVATADILRPDTVRNCRPLPRADVIADIEAAPDRLHDEYRARLARAVLGLLFGCGLRPGEVKNLRLRDYNEAESLLTIAYSKGRKTRHTYPPEHVLRALDSYLKVRPECSHGYFFAFDRARRLGDEGLRHLFRELLAVAGHKGVRITPHVGRHVCTSRLFASGADINTIRSILGHASFGTTVFYAHSTPEHQRNALEKAVGASDRNPPPGRAVSWF